MDLIAIIKPCVAGTRTKMELAWQKERESQKKLITELNTMARDLKATLLEVTSATFKAVKTKGFIVSLCRLKKRETARDLRPRGRLMG